MWRPGVAMSLALLDSVLHVLEDVRQIASSAKPKSPKCFKNCHHYIILIHSQEPNSFFKDGLKNIEMHRFVDCTAHHLKFWLFDFVQPTSFIIIIGRRCNLFYALGWNSTPYCPVFD